jgi:hypothetical protein
VARVTVTESLSCAAAGLKISSVDGSLAPQRLVDLGRGGRCAGRVDRDAEQVAVALGDDRDRAVSDLRVADRPGARRAAARRAAEEKARSLGTSLIGASRKLQRHCDAIRSIARKA